MVPNRDGELAIEGAQQIIVEKQHVDVFTAPNLAHVIERLAADRFVVYGVVTEICVLYAARGLLKYGKPLTIVTDAVAPLAGEASERALAESCRRRQAGAHFRNHQAMKYIDFAAARAAGSSALAEGPDARSGPGRSSDPRRGRGRQPARSRAARRQLSAASGSLAHPGIGSRGHDRRGGAGLRVAARATASARSSPAAATPSTAWRPECNACRCHRASPCRRPPASPRRSSRCGPTSSSSATLRPASASWCTAARAGSAPPRSNSRARLAPLCSPPQAATEKCRACEELGAERAINYKELDFAKEFRDIDLVLDMVGGAYTARNLEVLAPRGRLVQIAVQQGAKPP